MEAEKINAQPLVSIVLPVYNGSDFLAKSIDSCLAQTYRNWELIIVNDCSRDDSLAIAHLFAQQDDRIRVLNNEQNLKLPASLNRGFAAARGDYFTWTSHDNRMHERMLEVFVDYLERNPDAGLVTSDYTAIDENDQVLYPVEVLEAMKYMPLLNTVCYAFMYRREVAERVGEYNTNLFLIEDYDYWIRIWLNYPIGQIHESLYYTRVHGNTLTLKRKAEIAQRLFDIRLNYFEPFDCALRPFPDLRFKFCVSILQHAQGVEKWQLLCRFIKRNPRFGLKYLLIYNPKKIIKKLINR